MKKKEKALQKYPSAPGDAGQKLKNKPYLFSTSKLPVPLISNTLLA